MTRPLLAQYRRQLHHRIRKMILMYQEIADGHIVRQWVCLCNSDNRCNRCPVGDTYPRCVGPGGAWQPIGALVHTFHHCCSRSTEEVALDAEFRSALRGCVKIYAPEEPDLSVWTYERIIEAAAVKATAWQKWLDDLDTS